MKTTGKSNVAGHAWDNSECVGTPSCPPRCPRFIDKKGVPLLARPYEPSDGDALVGMYGDLDGYSRTLGLPPQSVTRIKSWLDHLVGDGLNLVATEGEQIVGHLAVVPADANIPEFVVFVHQDYRSRGVGTELVKQAIAYAEDRDYNAIKGSVSGENWHALAVYENVGFDVVDRIESELEIRLSLADSVAVRVQRPPAEREDGL